MSTTADQANGLTLSRTGNNTVRVASGTARDDGDTQDITLSSATTCDLTSSGLDGLDTGNRKADTWYAVWVIRSGTTTGTLASESFTNPTLPAGTWTKRRVGTIRTDGKKNVIRFSQIGQSRDRWYTWLSGWTSRRPTNGASNTGWTQVDMSAYVPKDAASGSTLGLSGTGELRAKNASQTLIAVTSQTSYGFIPESDVEWYEFRATGGGTFSVVVQGWSESI